MKKVKDNPVIAEVRRARHRISARVGHDPKRLINYYKKLEKKMRASGKDRFADEVAAPK
jgi:molybdenum-dependent DNA-binding transcriptional regulator ModE